MPRSYALAGPVLVAFALAVGGCGNDDASPSSQATIPATPPTTSPAETGTGPVASVPDAPPPPPDATAPLPPSTTEQQGPNTSTATTPPPPRARDNAARGGPNTPNESVRVPAVFTIRGTTLSPHQITVPPFLAVELAARSSDGQRHVVVLRTPQPHRLVVKPGGSAAVTIPGLRGGTYPVSLDGTDTGALFVGGEVGP
ncbi:MAG TPA: hypothetical protein VGM91_20310 [Conexibacter sp.]